MAVDGDGVTAIPIASRPSSCPMVWVIRHLSFNCSTVRHYVFRPAVTVCLSCITTITAVSTTMVCWEFNIRLPFFKLATYKVRRTNPPTVKHVMAKKTHCSIFKFYHQWGTTIFCTWLAPLLVRLEEWVKSGVHRVRSGMHATEGGCTKGRHSIMWARTKEQRIENFAIS